MVGLFIVVLYMLNIISFIYRTPRVSTGWSCDFVNSSLMGKNFLPGIFKYPFPQV